MLEKIRMSLRIRHNSLDSDIKNNIDACSLDLRRVGINISSLPDSPDALLAKAVELYCKWQFDYEGKAEQYCKAYENLRDSLSLTDEYREKKTDAE